MKIKINEQLVALNQYTNAERTNRYLGAKIKKEQTLLCKTYFVGLEPITKPITIDFKWGIGRHDPDNIAFGKKWILDGMVLAKFLPNDNFKWIKGFTDTFDKNIIGVEITIKEWEE